MAANPILGYFARATPLVVKEAFKSYVTHNPVMKKIYDAGRMKALVGTNVQIPFINARHSNATEISASTNWQANSKWAPIHSTMTFDWGQYAVPMVIPQENEWRVQDAADFRAIVNDISAAVVALMMRDIFNHILLGEVAAGNSNINQFPRIGTLNGYKTGLASSGLQAGALQFVAPASQTGTYMNRTRSYDTTDLVNNWYNQYATHSGIGADFFEKVEQIRLLTQQFSKPGGAGKAANTGINTGMVPLSMLSKISAALRTLPGTGTPQLMVTLAELEAGKGVPGVYVAGGVNFVGDYLWDLWGSHANANLDPANEPCFLLDPSSMGFYVQKGHDFNIGPLTDMRRFGQFVYMAWAMIALQFTVHNPMANGCLIKA